MPKPAKPNFAALLAFDVGCESASYPASAWGFFGDIEIVAPDWIFADGFESIDTAAWSSQQP